MKGPKIKKKNKLVVISTLESSLKYVCVIDQEVKMAGYWPSLFCVFMDLDEVEVNKHALDHAASRVLIFYEKRSHNSVFFFLCSK